MTLTRPGGPDRAPQPRHPERAHLWLGALVVLAILMAGVLSSSLVAPPSPFTALTFAMSSLLLIGSLALAVRIIRAVNRARSLVAAQPPAARSTDHNIPEPPQSQLGVHLAGQDLDERKVSRLLTFLRSRA